MVDAAILEQVLSHLYNWFERESFQVTDCRVEGGAMPALLSSSVPPGAWYRIDGSYLNDGLHHMPASGETEEEIDLEDETFNATVTVLAVPRAVLRLAEEIGEWQAKNGSAVDGPYQSESFGGYSYTKASSGSGGSGGSGATGWRLAFRDRLNPYRRLP